MRLAALGIAVALLAAACGDSGQGNDAAATTSTSGAEPTGYIDAVAERMEAISEAVSSLETTLRTVYEDQTVLFAAFADVNLPSVILSVEEAAARFEPPPAFDDDHATWLEALTAADPLAVGLRDALRNRLVVDVAIGVARLQTVMLGATTSTTPEFCDAIRLDADPAAICRPLPPPQAAWERASAKNALTFWARVGPMITGLRPSFTPDDRIDYLRRIQPEVEAMLADLAAGQAAVEAPAGRSADHDVLVAYYTDLARVSGEITAAAGAGDRERIDVLFAESIEIADRSRDGLSPAGLALVDPLFAQVGG